MKSSYPTIFSGSAVFIAYLICQEFTPEEQENIGNWFMLFGQFIVTYSGFASSSDSSSSQDTDFTTLQKALQKIENEIEALKNSEK